MFFNLSCNWLSIEACHVQYVGVRVLPRPHRSGRRHRRAALRDRRQPRRHQFSPFSARRPNSPRSAASRITSPPTSCASNWRPCLNSRAPRSSVSPFGFEAQHGPTATSPMSFRSAAAIGRACRPPVRGLHPIQGQHRADGRPNRTGGRRHPLHHPVCRMDPAGERRRVPEYGRQHGRRTRPVLRLGRESVAGTAIRLDYDPHTTR